MNEVALTCPCCTGTGFLPGNDDRGPVPCDCAVGDEEPEDDA